MAISLVSAELGGTLVETLLIGIYFTVFFMSIHASFSGRFRHTSIATMLWSPMTWSYFFIFACVTAHWVIDMARLFDAFIYGIDGSPLLVYVNISDGKMLAKTALYALEVICADSILVYRLYHVSKRSWAVIALPIATTIMTAASGIGCVVEFALASGAGGVWVNSPTGKWIVIVFTASLTTNLYCTSLIALRVWRSYTATKGMQAIRRSSAMRIIEVIVESAALYSACTLFVLIAYVSGSLLHFPGLDATSPVVGLVFSSIIVRIRLFGQANFTTQAATLAPAAHQLQAITVEIQRDQEVSADSDPQSEPDPAKAKSVMV